MQVLKPLGWDQAYGGSSYLSGEGGQAFVCV